MLELIPRVWRLLAVGDEATIACDGFPLGSAEGAEQPIPAQPIQTPSIPRRGAEAAPRPVLWFVDDPSPNRAEDDVAGELLQVGLLLYQDRLVPALEDVSVTTLN